MITDQQEREHWRDPGPGLRNANQAYYWRVQKIYSDHILQRILSGHEASSAQANTQLAADWVALARQVEGLRPPGEQSRTPAGSASAALKKQRHAARKHLLWLAAGNYLSDWILCGIEATILDRQGNALPPCAYRAQEQLPL